MLESRIKRILNDIIDNAYSDTPDEIRKKYKWFYLKLLPKELKVRNGRYNTRTHIIEVNNASRGISYIAKTCLHEVAHHIDWCKRYKTGHDKAFYDEYAKLIYATLNMKILKANELIDIHSRDNLKVQKILADYVPHYIDYMAQNESIIKIMNGYSVKEALKNRGYHWNNMEQVWEYCLDESIKLRELEFLINLGISNKNPGDHKTPWYSIVSNNLYIDAYILIEAIGNTYANRDALKANGFSFNTVKKNKWTCKVIASQLHAKMDSLRKCNIPDVQFHVSGRS